MSNKTFKKAMSFICGPEKYPAEFTASSFSSYTAFGKDCRFSSGIRSDVPKLHNNIDLPQWKFVKFIRNYYNSNKSRFKITKMSEYI
mgnify:FL=1